MSALPLLHSPADIVRGVLIDLGAASSPDISPRTAWPAFSGKEPDSPDEVITLYDTQGFSDGRFMIDGELFSHPGIQLRVRSKDTPRGYSKASQLRSALAGILNAELTIGANSYVLHCVAKISDVIALGDESPQSKRQLFTVNAVASVRRVS